MFPSFALPDQHGVLVSSDALRGRPAVIFFYPEDDTPSCTIEAQEFTALASEFDALGITLLGVSPDPVSSHRAFCDRHGLAMQLLSDPDATLRRAAGVGEVEWKGRTYWARTTFVLDEHGAVAKVYQGVKAPGHAAAVLADCRALRSGAPIDSSFSGLEDDRHQ